MAGVFGVFSYDGKDVLKSTYIGLRILQGRGQESAGISVGDGGSIRTYKRKGTVADVFDDKILKILDNPADNASIGHVRKFDVKNEDVIEPFELQDNNFRISVAMDGKFFDSAKFKKYGVEPDKSTELLGKVFLKNLIEEEKTNRAAKKTMMELGKGYYSAVMLVNDGKKTREIGIRDPSGLKPYCMGRLGQTYFLSSESVALDSLNASLLRDVKPGELIEFAPESSEPCCEQIMKPNPKFCAFEFNYGASRASVIEGKSVDEFRKEMGRKVFEFYRDQIKPGKVFPSPDSGRGVALGFAQASGFEYDEVVIKNPNAKRTFLIPNKDVREFEASVKFSVVEKAVKDQILYDGEDSTVRGTVALQNAKALKRAGAKEIYLVLGSPALISTCPDYIHEGPRTFIASKYQGKDVKEIGRCVAKEIGIDGVFYPTLDMEVEALGIPKDHLCLACFTGKYPFEIKS